MRRLLPLLLALPCLAGEVRVLGHDLELTLDPANGAFASVDRVRVLGGGRLEVAPQFGHPIGLGQSAHCVQVAPLK